MIVQNVLMEDICIKKNVYWIVKQNFKKIRLIIKDTNINKCEKCHATCKSCDLGEENNCLTCHGNVIVNASNECKGVSDCNPA